MKKNVNWLGLYFLLFLLFWNCALSGTRPDSAGLSQIESSLRNKYGGYFYAHGFIMDSVIGRIAVSDDVGEEVSDPYGTLQHLILFSADPLDSAGDNDPDLKGIAGFYKDGVIVWDSGPIIGDAAGALLYGSGDYTKSGKVDVLMDLGNSDASLEKDYLWIIRWDGTTGQFINQIDTSGVSTIITDESIELMDVDGDGVMEIRTDWPIRNLVFRQDTLMNTRPAVTYYWDGSVYRLGPRVNANTILGVLVNKSAHRGIEMSGFRFKRDIYLLVSIHK